MAKNSFFCVDGHTCGNPVRLVAGGGPKLKGATMLEKRAHFLAEFDWIRTGLMFEPRGHDIMSGSILYDPTSDDYDVAVLFIETSGCLPMCGHGTIGTVTMAIEEGLVTPKVPGRLRLETPAGLVIAEYKQVGDYVESVKLTNVPSFLYKTDIEVDCPDLGPIKVGDDFNGKARGDINANEAISVRGNAGLKAGGTVSLTNPGNSFGGKVTVNEGDDAEPMTEELRQSAEQTASFLQISNRLNRLVVPANRNIQPEAMEILFNLDQPWQDVLVEEEEN